MTEKKTDDTKTDEKPADDKPARSSSKKPTTIPMHHRADDRKWKATSHAEALELSGAGWHWDDPDQDTSNVPSGFTGPGKGTPTGGDAQDAVVL